VTHLPKNSAADAPADPATCLNGHPRSQMTGDVCPGCRSKYKAQSRIRNRIPVTGDLNDRNASRRR
jgi:hypothetical protein